MQTSIPHHFKGKQWIRMIAADVLFILHLLSFLVKVSWRYKPQSFIKDNESRMNANQVTRSSAETAWKTFTVVDEYFSDLSPLNTSVFLSLSLFVSYERHALCFRTIMRDSTEYWSNITSHEINLSSRTSRFNLNDKILIYFFIHCGANITF